MKSIITPIDKNVIRRELNDERFLRKTNKAQNEIYIINAHNAPNTMKEIGRLREVSFRLGGGGSGNEIDVDEFDFMEKPYQQIIVWNPDAEEIIGGYRFIHGKNVTLKPNGQPLIAMEHLFKFSDEWVQNDLPHTMELSRAFIQPKYQSAQMGLKSLFSLDNLWDGIGALIASYSDIKYLIGKVTIYSIMEEKTRNAIIFFLDKFFGNHDGHITPKEEISVPDNQKKELERLFSEKEYKDNYRILQNYVKHFGETIPSLIHGYIELSSSMQTFGTGFDKDFGDIYDTGMMITVDDIYAAKRSRYVETFLDTHSGEIPKLKL